LGGSAQTVLGLDDALAELVEEARSPLGVTGAA
jgi:hypothetical protein